MPGNAVESENGRPKTDQLAKHEGTSRELLASQSKVRRLFVRSVSMANVTDPNVGGIDPFNPPATPPRSKEVLEREETPEPGFQPAKEALHDLEQRVVELQTDKYNGSGLEAAQELAKFEKVLEEKSAEIKVKADAAFLGFGVECEGEPIARFRGDRETTAESMEEIEDREGQTLPSVVQEMLTDIRACLAQIDEKPDQAPVSAAENLDKVAEVLDEKLTEISRKKHDLAARELNDLDGFNR